MHLTHLEHVCDIPIGRKSVYCNVDPMSNADKASEVTVEAKFLTASSIRLNNLIGILPLTEDTERTSVVREIVEAVGVGEGAYLTSTTDEVHAEPCKFGILSVASSTKDYLNSVASCITSKVPVPVGV